MEEILQKLDEILKDVDKEGDKLNQNFQIFKNQLDSIVHGTKEQPSLTPQQKKKIKRLSVIVDDDAEISETDAEQIVKKQINEITIKTEIIETSTRSTRPVREARMKVGSFKEPTLGKKLRRPSEGDDTLSATKLILDKTVPNCANGSKKSPTTENTNKKEGSTSSKRSIEEDDKNNKNTSAESSKKVDESLIVVPNGDVVVELSDNDMDKLMPPPTELPKKRAPRKAKQSDASTEVSTRSSRLRIKQEKLSIDQAAGQNIFSNAPDTETENINKAIEEVKEEKVEDDSSSKRGRGKRGRKPFNCMPIKEDPDSKSNEQIIVDKETTKTLNSQTKSKEKDKPKSMESLYEDAISDNAGKVMIAKPTNANVVDNLREENAADATFVSANAETDATFVASACAQTTFVVEQPVVNETTSKTANTKSNKEMSPVDVTFSISDETFKTQPTTDQQINGNLMRSSIMTEEDSGDEFIRPSPVPAPVVLTKPNQKKELFNPCIQSPLKKKVEAFERHANAMGSPNPMRQTRTAKAKLKENKNPELNIPKHITPLLKREIGKHLTPTQYSNITPNIGVQPAKNLASSTSKLAQMHKTAKAVATGAISKTQSLSRENSVEDAKRAGYNSKLQQIADEKKKKREQKQQQVAQSREARERERTEKLKRAMHEREEKMRLKAQLDEINKKIGERDVITVKKVDKRQQELELSEATRKDREILENQRIQRTKDELKQKLLDNQRRHEEEKLFKQGQNTLKNDFDLLNSGDSTDDEDKKTSKRPPPPIWSKSKVRNIIMERQMHLPAKIIDSFFSVKPMTPDLREIFPAIDPRYLKRNSSMYWNTPPRYSQLPKY